MLTWIKNLPTALKWIIPLAGIAIVWLIKRVFYSKRNVELAEDWLNIQKDFQQDLEDNVGKDAQIRKIRQERRELEGEFRAKKLALEELNEQNDQALADYWNRAFGRGK